MPSLLALEILPFFARQQYSLSSNKLHILLPQHTILYYYLSEKCKQIENIKTIRTPWILIPTVSYTNEVITMQVELTVNVIVL